MFRLYILAIVREFQVWSACTAFIDWIYMVETCRSLYKNYKLTVFYNKYSKHTVQLVGSEICE